MSFLYFTLHLATFIHYADALGENETDAPVLVCYPSLCTWHQTRVMWCQFNWRLQTVSSTCFQRTPCVELRPCSGLCAGVFIGDPAMCVLELSTCMRNACVCVKGRCVFVWIIFDETSSSCTYFSTPRCCPHYPLRPSVGFMRASCCCDSGGARQPAWRAAFKQIRFTQKPWLKPSGEDLPFL